MIRIFDIVLSSLTLIIFSPLFIIVYSLIYIENKSPLFFQERVGKNMKKFTLIKFRTMKPGTKICATHLVDSSRITLLGKILRKTKIDELPQALNVLKGEMSIVGPRPCLISQKELINQRIKLNIHKTIPGITGLAQIKGIDMSNPKLLAETEFEMINQYNFLNYIYYITLTFLGKGFGDRVTLNK